MNGGTFNSHFIVVYFHRISVFMRQRALEMHKFSTAQCSTTSKGKNKICLSHNLSTASTPLLLKQKLAATKPLAQPLFCLRKIRVKYQEKENFSNSKNLKNIWLMVRVLLYISVNEQFAIKKNIFIYILQPMYLPILFQIFKNLFQNLMKRVGHLYEASI